MMGGLLRGWWIGDGTKRKLGLWTESRGIRSLVSASVRITGGRTKRRINISRHDDLWIWDTTTRFSYCITNIQRACLSHGNSLFQLP